MMVDNSYPVAKTLSRATGSIFIGWAKLIGGIKYNKSTIRNQSIINKIISSLMGPKSLLVKNKHVLKKVDF